MKNRPRGTSSRGRFRFLPDGQETLVVRPRDPASDPRPSVAAGILAYRVNRGRRFGSAGQQPRLDELLPRAGNEVATGAHRDVAHPHLRGHRQGAHEGVRRARQADRARLREPEVVIEVDFQDIQKTDRYSSGYALRIPRFRVERTDKSIREADTLARYQTLQTNLKGLDSKSLGTVGWWPAVARC